MPLSCDPSATALYVLAGAAGKTPTPAFVCRFLTRRQISEHRRLLKQAESAQGDAFWDLVWQAIAIGVVGWQNISEKPFGREALEDSLTEAELMELAARYPDAVTMAEHDRKNSSAPHSHTPGAAAADAGARTAGGPATTAPASGSPSGIPEVSAASAAA